MSEKKIMEKLSQIHTDVGICLTKIETQKEITDDHEKRIRKSETFRLKLMGSAASLSFLLLWTKIKTFFGFPDA